MPMLVNYKFLNLKISEAMHYHLMQLAKQISLESNMNVSMSDLTRNAIETCYGPVQCDKSKKEWQNNEIVYIQRYKNQCSVEEIANSLCRSKEAVRKKINQINKKDHVACQ